MRVAVVRVPTWLWRRIGARLIDTAVIAAAIALILCIIGLGAVAAGGWAADDEPGGGFLGSEFVSAIYLSVALFILGPPASLAVWFVYEAVLPRRSGQTLGKKLLGLRVVKCDDKAQTLVGCGPLIARSLILHVVSLIGLVVTLIRLVSDVRIDWPAEIVNIAAISVICVCAMVLPAAVSRSRRGVHDWVAGTVVVSAPTGREQPGRRGPGDEGFDRWQGFMRGGSSASRRGGLRQGAVRLCA